MTVQSVFFLVVGLLLLVYMVRLVRNLKLREKYAALWLVSGLVIVVLMVFPKLLDPIASLVGVVTPVNLLFLIAILLLLGVCLHLSLEISRLEDETRVLAEEVAIQRSLLNRQLDRSSQQRNPTASLPVIRIGEDGQGLHPDSTSLPADSSAGRRDSAEDTPGRVRPAPLTDDPKDVKP